MKFQVTNPKAWKAVNEKNIPMSHKIKVYEKLGGAYRLGESGGEQVFNKMTELLKHKISEGDEKSPEQTLDGLKNMAMGDLERIADYANMISQRMGEGQELDSWMYSQITLAVDQLNSVHDSMDGKDGEKESINEEKVYIDFLNKKKGFKQDRVKFNSYEAAVKWARKNFEKFDPDMIKYESVNEGPESDDHEVGMANGQLDDIIRNATELKGKVGQKEMNLPGWISDHISQAMQFINQANTGFHKLEGK